MLVVPNKGELIFCISAVRTFVCPARDGIDAEGDDERAQCRKKPGDQFFKQEESSNLAYDRDLETYTTPAKA